jgi:hypothetical protein
LALVGERRRADAHLRHRDVDQQARGEGGGHRSV